MFTVIRGDTGSGTLGYILSIQPLIFSLIAIPPLLYHYDKSKAVRQIVAFSNNTLSTEDAKLFSYVYQFFGTDQLTLYDAISMCRCASDDKDSQRNISMISYLFIHTDYNHLFSNISALCFAGYPVYEQFGPIAVYVLFFLGGAASVTPTVFLQKETVSRRLSIIPKKLLDSLSTSNPISGFAKTILSKVNSVASTIVNHFSDPKFAGSSGSAYAFVGCEFGCLIGTVVSHFYQSYVHVSKTMERRRVSLIDSDRTISNGSIVATLQKVLVYQFDFAKYLLKDMLVTSKLSVTIHTAWRLGYLAVIGYREYCSIAANDSIGHAGHLQGFVFGASFGLVLWPLVVKPIGQQPSRSNYHL